MYRPAWRMSHTGVRSTCWPKAQRTRMSRSPVFIPLIFVVASVSVVEWRAGDALINDDGVKAEVLAIALNDVIGVRTFMSQFVYVDDRCLVFLGEVLVCENNIIMRCGVVINQDEVDIFFFHLESC